MAEGRLPKIALKWIPKQKRARGRPKKKWMEGIRKDMNERNLNEGQWKDRKQWSLGVGQRRKTFWNRYIYIYIYIYHNCTLVIRTSPWRWPEYRPKHFDENIMNKVHPRRLKCVLLVIYIFYYIYLLYIILDLLYYIYIFFICQLKYWTVSPEPGDRYEGLPHF